MPPSTNFPRLGRAGLLRRQPVHACRMSDKGKDTVEISAQEYEELLRKAGRADAQALPDTESRLKLKDALTGFLSSNAGKDLMDKAGLQVAGKEKAAAEMTKGFLGGGGEGEALRSAAKEGNTDRIVEILERGETAVDAAEFPSGNTPLMFAATENNPEAVRTLLKAGAEVDRLDIGGLSALHKAAQKGSADATKALLEGGADASLQTPERVGSVYPLQWAASAESMSAMEVLLAHGAPVNAQDGRGFSALHVAAAKGSKACISLLLEKGADAAIKNKEGLTPHGVAQLSKAGDPEVLSLLA